MTQPLGVNLSFCVKRWVTPALWTEVVRQHLATDLVQLSFDLIDPMWPDEVKAKLAKETRAAAAAQGITIHSAFIGLAHYTFNQLLHPEPAVRAFAEAWLVRAMDFAKDAGIPRVGGPLGAIASRVDGHEADALPEADYADLVARMRRLSQAAHERGLVELLVEPTPMRREWPWTIGQARQLMDDLSGAPVPWSLCVDWGHGTYEPLYGTDHGEMRPWLHDLAGHIGALHLQQTDYQLDCHWDFTKPGRVDPHAAKDLIEGSGLGQRPVFLEVFYPFELDDAAVLARMARSMDILRTAFAR
ncbi:MAG: sugar phosphate isomerase/epimerase [Geminicoccaceae bacterium]|nr:MAG: sugar phosphate isomerase/epimerase [Geminicoccaceae bacterium]